MIKLEIISWEDAEKIILNEQNLLTNAFLNLTTYWETYWEDMDAMFDLLHFAAKDETKVEDIKEMPEEIYMHLKYLLTLLPGIMLMHPNEDWTKLINSIIAIVDNYVGIYFTVCKSRPELTTQAAYIDELRPMINACAKHLELGAITETLVPTLAWLVKEVKQLHASQPISFQLSSEYLKALNFPTSEINEENIL